MFTPLCTQKHFFNIFEKQSKGVAWNGKLQVSRARVRRTLAILARSAALLLIFPVLCANSSVFTQLLKIRNGRLKNRSLACISSKLDCTEKHHLGCMWIVQRRCKRGTVAQRNPAIIGKQWFKQSHSKCYFEIVCGKPNFNNLFPSLTWRVRFACISHCLVPPVRQSVPSVHFVALKIISDRPWLNVG